MFAGRKRKRKPLFRQEFDNQRIAAFKIVYAAIEEALGPNRNPFEAGAIVAASEAVVRHPHAGDEQIIAFLRWFSGDGNPMP